MISQPPPRPLRLELSHRLGDLQLDVALDVGAGGCLALVGPSGAGKSTVLGVVAGLVTPDRGRVTLGEEPWLDTEAGVDLPPERRRCGYVFQDHALFGHLTAAQNVAYGLKDLPRAERRPRALALLEDLGLAARADARPRTLSGGERQRVALARALARDPDVLLLDEPLSALDARTRASASRRLAEVLRRTRVPAILVTHDFAEAAALADEVAVLDHGRVVQRGPARELAARPASAFVADVTGAVTLPGLARPGPGGTTAVELDDGGELVSVDPGEGPVTASVFPWEVELGPVGDAAGGSAQNRLTAEVVALTSIGGRVRVQLDRPEGLVAEVTEAAVTQLGLQPGRRVTASFKAAATRLTPR